MTPAASFPCDRNTIEELERDLEHYRRLEELSPDCIFMVDRDLIVRYVNGTAARFLKKNAREITGKPLKQFLPPATYETDARRLRQVFGSGMAATSSERVSFPEIELFMNTKWLPVRDESGSISEVLFISRDISEFRQPDAWGKDASDATDFVLSRREVQVLSMVAEGMTNKEIGEALFISPKTVDTHRTRIMKKLDAHNAVELIRRAREARLLE